MSANQILTVAEMRAAEQALFDTGIAPVQLMERAAAGAAEWVRRIAAARPVTVLCGPGNNGGDGYVIARLLREWGHDVMVVAPIPAKSDTAIEARSRWDGPIARSAAEARGGVFIDCLFGSGLSRPLTAAHALLLRDCAAQHQTSIAIDLPSGIASDTGAILAERLPRFDATLALGAWKFAHCFVQAQRVMGSLALVRIGIEPTQGAAMRIDRPQIEAPRFDAHKYSRGLLAIVGGAMPGASLLSARAAMRGGAGYVRWLSEAGDPAQPAGLVRDGDDLCDALGDKRIDAICIGPGLGRGEQAKSKLREVLKREVAAVLDADALTCLEPAMLDGREAPIIATPHDGELQTLCRTFAVISEERIARARALAKASGMIIVAKGPESLVAAPEGSLAMGPAAPSWLSVAGTGDVLAGITASRLATLGDPFDAACEGLWLHADAAHACGAAFTADDLAAAVSGAIARSLGPGGAS